MKVAIAGAGIGGLTAALCFAQRGFKVTLIERASATAPASGAGIQIGPNALQVLRALGCEDALIARASVTQAAVLRDGKSGRPLLRVPLGEDCVRRYGAPYLQLQRAALIDVLTQAAGRAGVQIDYQRALQSWQQHEASVSLICANGSAIEADLLIGADGIRSQVRAGLAMPQRPVFSGQVVWRGQIASRLVSLPEAVVNLWLGPGQHFVAYDLGASSGQINFVAAAAQSAWTASEWTQPAESSTLQRRFADWDPLIHELLAVCSDCTLWGLFEMPGLPSWSEGRVVLLGDACHPMLPYQAQGAAAAIEDAYVLAHSCAPLGDCPASSARHHLRAALQNFEAIRQPRTQKLQRLSRTNARLFHLRAAPLRLGRDFMFRLATHLAPLRHWRLDPMYGFDVTQAVP